MNVMVRGEGRGHLALGLGVPTKPGICSLAFPAGVNASLPSIKGVFGATSVLREGRAPSPPPAHASPPSTQKLFRSALAFP